MALIPKYAAEVYENQGAYIKDVLNYTTAGGAATEAVTIDGIKTTDTLSVTLVDNGTANVTLTTAQITADNTITLTFSLDPGADTIVNIIVARPISFTA